MNTKSPFSLGAMVVLSIVAVAAVALSIDTTLNAYAQNTTATTNQTTATNQTANPQQIKDYLSQAIQALDSGNNTKALEQVDLAGDQLESMTGTEDGEGEDDDDEEEGGIEEGAGEDADEPGDVDTNDQEDTP
jgi:hypothetical protein